MRFIDDLVLFPGAVSCSDFSVLVPTLVVGLFAPQWTSGSPESLLPRPCAMRSGGSSSCIVHFNQNHGPDF